MGYNLTDRQEHLLRWLVQQIRDGQLPEEFNVAWLHGGANILQFKGEHPEITKGALDALANADLLLCTVNYESHTAARGTPVEHITQLERSRRCTMTGRAFEAIDSDFESPTEVSTQVTIGAIIHSMGGGSVQAVGVAQDAEISQVVSDPDLLRSQVEALAENLVNEVKSSLKVDELAEYAEAVRELREQLLMETPEPRSIRRLARTVGLLGDIEGTIGLMTRVWTLLHPLLLIAAANVG